MDLKDIKVEMYYHTRRRNIEKGNLNYFKSQISTFIFESVTIRNYIKIMLQSTRSNESRKEILKL